MVVPAGRRRRCRQQPLCHLRAPGAAICQARPSRHRAAGTAGAAQHRRRGIRRPAQRRQVDPAGGADQRAPQDRRLSVYHHRSGTGHHARGRRRAGGRDQRSARAAGHHPADAAGRLVGGTGGRAGGHPGHRRRSLGRHRSGVAVPGPHRAGTHAGLRHRSHRRRRPARHPGGGIARVRRGADRSASCPGGHQAGSGRRWRPAPPAAAALPGRRGGDGGPRTTEPAWPICAALSAGSRAPREGAARRAARRIVRPGAHWAPAHRSGRPGERRLRSRAVRAGQSAVAQAVGAAGRHRTPPAYAAARARRALPVCGQRRGGTARGAFRTPWIPCASCRRAAQSASVRGW